MGASAAEYKAKRALMSTAVRIAMIAGAPARIASTMANWLAPATTIIDADAPAHGLIPATLTSAPNARPNIAEPIIRGAIALHPAQASAHCWRPMPSTAPAAGRRVEEVTRRVCHA